MEEGYDNHEWGESSGMGASDMGEVSCCLFSFLIQMFVDIY